MEFKTLRTAQGEHARAGTSDEETQQGVQQRLNEAMKALQLENWTNVFTSVCLSLQWELLSLVDREGSGCLCSVVMER